MLVARDAELGAIRAQFQPHFVLNALNSLLALIDKDPALARTMVVRLADVMKSVFDRMDVPAVPLERELDLVKAYLDVERIRFGARLSAAFEIDDAARGVLVPPFLLQPIVENAVKHGIAPNAAPGTVRVSARVHNGRLRPRSARLRHGRGLGPRLRPRPRAHPASSRNGLSRRVRADVRPASERHLGAHLDADRCSAPCRVSVLRLLIADDEPLARDLARRYAAAQPDVEVVSECASGDELARALARGPAGRRAARHPHAGRGRLQRARARGRAARSAARRHLRHGVRQLRRPRVRSERGRLPRQAVHGRSLRRRVAPRTIAPGIGARRGRARARHPRPRPAPGSAARAGRPQDGRRSRSTTSSGSRRKTTTRASTPARAAISSAGR